MRLFARGRRLFSWASIAMILVAILHTIGNIAPSPAPNPRLTALEAAMRDYRFPLGIGMEPSVWDIQWALVLTMTVCLLAMGVLGLALAAHRDATPALLSRAAAILAVASGSLTVLYFVYRIPPPFISLGVVTILYGLSIWTTKKT